MVRWVEWRKCLQGQHLPACKAGWTRSRSPESGRAAIHCTARWASRKARRGWRERGRGWASPSSRWTSITTRRPMRRHGHSASVAVHHSLRTVGGRRRRDWHSLKEMCGQRRGGRCNTMSFGLLRKHTLCFVSVALALPILLVSILH
jgi:hypothetical protein